MEMDVLSAIAGAILSLIFSYMPKARNWFESLDGTQKRLTMLLLLALAALLQLALACSGLAAEFGLAATCDRAGLVALVQAFILAAMANQTTFLLSPKSGVAIYPSENMQ